MTPEAQRIALAEWEGWTNVRPAGTVIPSHLVGCYGPTRGFQTVPDYLNDLNAVHRLIHLAAEREGFASQALYQLRLQEVVERRRRDLTREQIGWWMNNAEACQRCEALLKNLGLWKE